jgi:hypothetical protein
MRFVQKIVAGPTLDELKEAVFGGKHRPEIRVFVKKEWLNKKPPKEFDAKKLAENLSWPAQMDLVWQTSRKRAMVSGPIFIQSISPQEVKGRVIYEFSGKVKGNTGHDWFAFATYSPQTGKGEIIFSI